MYEAELIAGPELFHRVPEQSWNELAEAGMTNTPFQRHAYQSAWWRFLGEGELLGIVVRDENERLVGIGCFNLRADGRLVFNASKEETDYLDLIARPADAEGVWAAVFDCLQGDDCPTWQLFDCYNVPAVSPTRTILPRLAQSRGFLFQEEVAEVCPIIGLTGDFEEYLAGIDKKQRHEIRRKLRRAQGAKAELEIVRDSEALGLAVDQFLDLLSKSTVEKSTWLNEGRIQLFHEVARRALDEGTLLLMFMTVSGERISGLFNFCYNDRVWVYNSGIDVSRFGHLSLGVVVTTYAIQTAIEQGCHVFDFLRGDETYKYRFGAADTEIFRLTITHPA